MPCPAPRYLVHATDRTAGVGYIIQVESTRVERGGMERSNDELIVLCVSEKEWRHDGATDKKNAKYVYKYKKKKTLRASLWGVWGGEVDRGRGRL